MHLKYYPGRGRGVSMIEQATRWYKDQHKGADEAAAAAETTCPGTPAAGAKCTRCWRWEETVGQHETHPEICERCVEAVS